MKRAPACQKSRIGGYEVDKWDVLEHEEIDRRSCPSRKHLGEGGQPILATVGPIVVALVIIVHDQLALRLRWVSFVVMKRGMWAVRTSVSARTMKVDREAKLSDQSNQTVVTYYVSLAVCSCPLGQPERPPPASIHPPCLWHEPSRRPSGRFVFCAHRQARRQRVLGEAFDAIFRTAVNLGANENSQFILSKYTVIKQHNPDLPILIREADGTPARAFARFGAVSHCTASHSQLITEPFQRAGLGLRRPTSNSVRGRRGACARILITACAGRPVENASDIFYTGSLTTRRVAASVGHSAQDLESWGRRE